MSTPSTKNGFKVGSRIVRLFSCEDETAPPIQRILCEAYRCRSVVTCLCRPEAAFPLEICFLQDSQRYYLKRKSIFHLHSDSCFLNQRRDSSPQDQEVEITGTIFDALKPSVQISPVPRVENQADTEIDGDTERTIRKFGAMAGYLLAQAYVETVLPLPGIAKARFRSPVTAEILNAFTDRVAMTKVEEKNGNAKISCVLLDLARRRGGELFWGIGDGPRFENNSAGARVGAVITAQNWTKLPRFHLEPNFELSGVHQIFGGSISGPYFFVGLAQATGAATRLLKLFLYPAAASDKGFCPVESTAERRWTEQAWAQGRAPIKILSNRSLMPLLRHLPDRIALVLAEGLHRRWRPDLIEVRSSRIVVIEIAGLTNDPDYAANLAAKENFWRALARQGDFDYEVYEPTPDGEFKLVGA